MRIFNHKLHAAKANDQVSSNEVHRLYITQDLLTGAATFVAGREFQKHCKANGRPPSVVETQALLAGFAGDFIDQVVDTQHLRRIDKAKAKSDASSTTAMAYAYDPTLEQPNNDRVEEKSPPQLLKKVLHRTSNLFSHGAVELH